MLSSGGHSTLNKKEHNTGQVPYSVNTSVDLDSDKERIFHHVGRHIGQITFLARKEFYYFVWINIHMYVIEY